MSLEQDMRDLKNALQELTATLKAFPPASAAPKAFVPDVTHNPEQAKAEVAPPKSELTSAPAAGTTAPSTTAGIDYAQVAKAITDTFKVDRAKTIAALAKFGAAKGPQLKPEDYAAFLKELAA